ncbi:hypothetical protein BRAO285_1220052 [Bradyrhizobium sp. ORS 285]|nr:hypothetical protein BRAO285_1220052 [Bradyrhizobium sp. ORS 285]
MLIGSTWRGPTMFTEEDKRRCMLFQDGRLTEGQPPEWFRRHVEGMTPEGDWRDSLSRAGASAMESFGEVETITLHRCPTGYFVDYWDSFEPIAWIFIDRPVDYLVFRATYLAPLVQLLLETEQQADSDVRKSPI